MNSLNGLLEPYEGKLSRTVLRGLGAGNSPRLPGASKKFYLFKINTNNETALDMNKSQKRNLREMAKRCYEIEMSQALQDLYEDFKKWNKNEITAWELNDKIHQHHNGTARDLYKFYELSGDSRVVVSRAVVKGIITIEEVQENCRPLLARFIEGMSDVK